MTSSDEQLKECLQKQLDEVDLLSSIYCNPGEFTIINQMSIVEITEFVKAKYDFLAQSIDFIVKFTTDDDTKIEVRVALPHMYPLLEMPYITIRSAKYNKAQEICIKGLLKEYMENECDKSDTYIYQILSWIQENLERFDTLNDNKQEMAHAEHSQCEKLMELERLWIYSHHIKSKTKRQNIVKIARDLNLTGFMRPGKPGVICVEGFKDHTQDFWRTIKQWNWHKITLRKTESAKIEDENFQLFGPFKEHLFTTSDEKDEEIPMDMSQFMKFLDTHKCAYIKEYLFGF